MAKVVLIEDLDLLRDLFADMLTTWGHEVLAFNDGAPALASVDFAAVDLVITDMEMPTDGRTVIQTLRERGLTVPIVMVSGSLSDHQPAELLDLGAQAVLPKPVDTRRLKETLDCLLKTCLA